MLPGDMSNFEIIPAILTIAGSDSSGGAGIQADLKTIEARRGYGTSVITALTAQNTVGVQGVWETPIDAVEAQLSSILVDVPPKAIKTGMMASTEIIKRILVTLSNTYSLPHMSECLLPRLPPLIVDPVSVSTSRHLLLSSSAVHTLLNELVPAATLVTPNIPEAEMISSYCNGRSGIGPTEQLGTLYDDHKVAKPIRNLIDMLEAATDILSFMTSSDKHGYFTHDRGVLLKGGHCLITRSTLKASLNALDNDVRSTLEVVWDGACGGANADEETFVNVLNKFRSSRIPGHSSVDEDPRLIVDVLMVSSPSKVKTTTLFVTQAVDTSSTHGTGCTLSAAIATHLGIGYSLKQAVQEAIKYVQTAIVTAEVRGKGNGPLNHLCSTVPRAVALPTAMNPHPFMQYLLRGSQSEWHDYVKHSFVQQLARGTLPAENFKHYIIQDWNYLKHYARAHALAASKTTDFEEIKAFSEIALHIARESQMHVDFCAKFGVTLAELQASKESPSNTSYSHYILDIGHRYDNLELLVAVFSCLVGYGEVGLYIRRKIDEGKDGFVLEGNPYRQWIEDYSGQEFLEAVYRGIETLERRIAREQPSVARSERLRKIWTDCVVLETNFWQMGLDCS